MGVTTNGELWYGVVFEEGYKFPWTSKGVHSHSDYLEEWWLRESGWDVESPYDERGDYKPGYRLDDPRVDAYFKNRRKWLKSHPCPVELVNYQSGEAPAYSLAIPGTVKTARRGYPEPVDPDALVVPGDCDLTFWEFIERHGLKPKGDGLAQWWLTSYWGW